MVTGHLCTFVYHGRCKARLRVTGEVLGSKHSTTIVSVWAACHTQSHFTGVKQQLGPTQSERVTHACVQASSRLFRTQLRCVLQCESVHAVFDSSSEDCSSHTTQAMVDSGILTIVLWDSWPIHMITYRSTERYYQVNEVQVT